jgi:translation elongation factor EF-Tu-like GTPase
MNANITGPRRFLIEERFHITGRGTVVVIGETTELPVGKALRATIVRPDSSKLSTEAFKEWPLRREQRPLEKEAYLLRGVEKSDIPEGSFVEIELVK